MRAPEFWTKEYGLGKALGLILSPLGALYGLSVRLRRNGARPFRPRARVICVGNLTAGGTGKTPVAIALAVALKEKGRRVAFLTRGYGGSISGPMRVEAGKHYASDVGDEALLLATVAPTIVARDRAAGAAMADELADVIVMDDGFQNFSVAKDLSLLVIDAGGFGNRRLIPAGPLRERPEHGFARAHAAVLIDNAQHDLTPFRGERLHARTEIAGPLNLEGRKVFAFCGIGKPDKFFRTLTEMGAMLVGAKAFPDHHNFSRTDIERLKTRADALGALPVTTEKDFLRLDEEAREGVLPVPIRIVFEDAAACSALLLKLAT